ncbi:MAG: glycosyltransferase [Acidobacteriales bacterium]|nr:glycosyltransferase [Terriglobales bacterium]
MIAVLEVLASLRRAGAERVAVSLACGLERTRFKPAVVSLYDAFPGGFEAELEAHGVPVFHLGKRRGFDPRMWTRLARVIREVRPSIIHTHSYVLRYVMPAWMLARRGRVVHTVHNLAGREVELAGRMVHRVAFRAGAVPVAISDEVARSFRETYGRDPGAVIYNGTEVENGFQPGARDSWRRAQGFRSADLLIVSLARFEAQKNPQGLIRAFARALPRLPSGYLVMAGEGTLLTECRELASSLGISERIRFLGLCQDVAELLSACDIFALASDWEGVPVAVIEAMAAGLPVVATAVGGVSELVEEGVTGVLAPPRDVEAVSKAIVELASNPERLRQMSVQARKRAHRFDSAVMIESYARLFERLCGGAA